VGLAGAALLLAGCSEETPTSSSEDLVQVRARSVEVRLPFSEFGSDFRILGGYGSPVALNQGVLARRHQGALDARTLSRFGSYPRAIAVRDTTGTAVADSSLTFVGGRVVATLDTVAPPDEPVTIRAAAVRTPWHAATTSWELAVDTVGRREAWPEPGGGPVTLLDSAVWDPEEGDTVSLRVDSATVAQWGDSTAASRGLRLDLLTEGFRVDVRNVELRLETRPSVNPDTTVFASVGEEELTFIYDPFPEPPEDGMRIGGVPAWRTVFRMELPETLNGPERLCETLGCPFSLDAGAVNFAALVVTTRASPGAFRPRRTISLDVRPVLSPERLPKAPLASSLVGPVGRELRPAFFEEDGAEEITLPVTAYTRNLLRGETTRGEPVPPTVAFLSSVEPVSLSFASFFGPGSEREPFLRLILTEDDGVTLP